MQTLVDLLVDQIKDLYSAENQLVKALPKMAKKASNESLKSAITEHLQETEGQVKRLNEIAGHLKIKPTGKACKAMEGLIAEGKEVIEEEGDPAVLDAALIAAAQRVEHYEISSYGTARAIAEQLGKSEIVELLDETLDEELAADKKLTAVCQDEIFSSMEEDQDDEMLEDEDEEDEESLSAR